MNETIYNNKGPKITMQYVANRHLMINESFYSYSEEKSDSVITLFNESKKRRIARFCAINVVSPIRKVCNHIERFYYERNYQE